MARKRHDLITLFVLISVGVHLAVLVAFLVSPALRDAVFGHRAPRAQPVIPGLKLRPIAKDRRIQTARNLRAQIAELQQALTEMEALRDPQLAKVASVQGKAVVDDLRNRLKFIQPKPTAELAGQQVRGPNSDEGVFQAWDDLRAAEAQVVDTYQHLRAARMMQKGEEMEQAVILSRVERPMRRGINKALFTTDFLNSTDPKIDLFKKEVDTLEDDSRQIVAFSRKLLETAQAGERLEKQGVSINVSEGSVGSMAYSGPALLPTEMFTSDVSFSLGDFKSVPGRRVTDSGKNGLWMHVSDWYMCGPFSNEGRRNLNTRFLPEVGVDLDASYTGKAGQLLRWYWKRCKAAKVEPDNVDNYCVWYCSTDLFFDRDRDLFVALGSDDYGKLWVNDKLVWASPQFNKPYNAAEHIQKIHFNQGFNKLLFRLENAGGTTGFSVIICTREFKGK